MASLVEELVTVLEEEEKIYQTLISYGEKKTDIQIRADVPELEKLTCLEQLASDDLVTHSNQQVQLLKDSANVLGRTEEKMTVTRLIALLESQPDVQKKLTEAGLWYATASEEDLIQLLSQEPGLFRDWDEKYGDRMQKIVFIGQHLDKEQLTRDLDECLE